MNYQIELSRSNCTVAQFLAYCRSQCKKQGMTFEIDIKEFRNPSYTRNDRYYIKDDKKICVSNGQRSEWPIDDTPCQSEILIISPLFTQTYLLNHDGSMYKETCEFTFDNEGIGHGYYCQINKD